MARIKKSGFIGLLVAALALVASIFFPWWGMRLTAPQYPEGLYIYVYPYKMTGQLDIINNLNHYIGMAKFSEANFPELQYLPYIIGIMAVITVIVAFLRKRRFLFTWLIVIVIGALLGLYDIHRWLHKFGTDLDPRAPIKIDPFVPPILGTNKLANFHTLSFFSYGAACAGIAILIMVIVFMKGTEK